MTQAGTDHPNHRFDHLALFYEGEDDFVARTLPFVREGAIRNEPVMVATSARKCDRLAAALDGAAGGVEFLDMTEAGRNPATILPVWRAFTDRHPGRRVRGIGEPVWPERTADELAECEHHESLLNLAFANAPAFELICPYDAATLDPDVIERAHRTHPRILENGEPVENPDYLPPELAPGPFDGELAPPPHDALMLRVDDHELAALRRFVGAWAAEAGLPDRRAADLALAVHELASNSLRHGGGAGTLLAWETDGDLLCEVRDGGSISEPLTGRRHPDPTATSGRGLWIVNHLCDLVQIRSGPRGNAVRVRMALAPTGARKPRVPA